MHRNTAKARGREKLLRKREKEKKRKSFRDWVVLGIGGLGGPEGNGVYGNVWNIHLR
jgi:hypothetical protein